MESLISGHPEIRSIREDDPLAVNAVCSTQNLAQWLEMTPAMVVNRGLANHANSAKAYQLQQIRPFFKIPDTIITNDPQVVCRFVERHCRVIYKSASGERSLVSELNFNDLSERHEALTNCPVLFQQWIHGTDVRVHVIGNSAIATAVSSESTDYRYDSDASWRPYTLSAQIETACILLAESMSLELAGIDLRITPEGQIYCFEVNPSPAFSAYQESTGQPISAAVASHLISAWL